MEAKLGEPTVVSRIHLLPAEMAATGLRATNSYFEGQVDILSDGSYVWFVRQTNGRTTLDSMTDHYDAGSEEMQERLKKMGYKPDLSRIELEQDTKTKLP